MNPYGITIKIISQTLITFFKVQNEYKNLTEGWEHFHGQDHTSEHSQPEPWQSQNLEEIL